MNRFTALLGAMALLFSACAEASPLPTEEALKERVLGQANAPVTIIEYSSLSCPHCAQFHNNVLPKLKKNYIDTGKVKLVYRDFPLGGPAYIAAMMARCAKPDRYFQFLDVLFRDQANWARSHRRLGRLAPKSTLSPTAVLRPSAQPPTWQHSPSPR